MLTHSALRIKIIHIQLLEQCLAHKVKPGSYYDGPCQWPSPSFPPLLVSVSVQVFWEADRLSRERFRLQCPSDKDLENPLRSSRAKIARSRNPTLGRRSGRSTAILLGHWPGKSVQEECGISSNIVHTSPSWLASPFFKGCLRSCTYGCHSFWLIE